MPSEWVGVVGALGGAAIGGVVTVASLIVKGQQDEVAEKRRNNREDEQRQEDRAWTVKQQNLDNRRELYSRLLRDANGLISSVGFLTPPSGMPNADQARAEAEQQVDKLRLAFLSHVADATVTAVDRSVLEVAEEISKVTSEACTVHMIDTIGGDMAASLKPFTHLEWDDVEAAHHRLAHKLLPALRNACRRDLGYDIGDESPVGGD